VIFGEFDFGVFHSVICVILDIFSTFVRKWKAWAYCRSVLLFQKDVKTSAHSGEKCSF